MVPRQRLSGAVHSWRGGSFRRGKNLPCFTAILVSSLLQLRKRRSESTYGATRFSLTALPTDILIHQGAPNTRRFRSFSRVMAIFTNGINGRERASFYLLPYLFFPPFSFQRNVALRFLDAWLLSSLGDSRRRRVPRDCSSVVFLGSTKSLVFQDFELSCLRLAYERREYNKVFSEFV